MASGEPPGHRQVCEELPIDVAPSSTRRLYAPADSTRQIFTEPPYLAVVVRFCSHSLRGLGLLPSVQHVRGVRRRRLCDAVAESSICRARHSSTTSTLSTARHGTRFRVASITRQVWMSRTTSHGSRRWASGCWRRHSAALFFGVCRVREPTSLAGFVLSFLHLERLTSEPVTRRNCAC